MNSKSAIITGAAKRIGKGIALNLAENGYDIALTYNNSQKEALELKDDIIAKYKVRCEIFKCDFLNENEFNLLFDKISQSFNDIQLLVNNASIFEKSNFLIENNEFDRNFNIHLKAPIALIKSFTRYVETNNISNANIINMLDKNITRHSTKFFYYLLSKKTLCELTKMLATELAPRIRINAIAPGYILDDHFIEKSENLKNRIIEKTPLLTKGTVKNIVKTVRFIIDNDYITGQILFIDGGSGLDLTNN